MTTILIKKKDTTGAPSSGDLTNAAGGAEIAVNTFDKRLYTKDSGGTVVELGTNPTDITTGTVETTNLEVTNIKAKDGTAAGSIADATGVVTLASSVLTTTDINGGTIDGATIGGASAAAGSFTTLNTSGAVVFNDAGADVDFRVEGDTVANLLFVDASTDRVGIGTNAPGAKLDVLGATADQLRLRTAATEEYRIGRNASTGLLNFYGSQAGFTGYVFGGVDGDRVTIDSSGNLLVNRTAANGKFCVDRAGTDVGNGIHYECTGASITAGQVAYRCLANGTGADGTNFTAFIVRTENANRCVIYGNGNIENINNSYGALSDVKLKQDIVDAASQWNDIKDLRIRKYHFKDDANGPLQLGVIAQEVEEVSPGLVNESPDYEEVEVTDEEGNVTTERQATGTVTKGVKYSVLYMKAVKALQEAMERIETLEAKVAALENA